MAIAQTNNKVNLAKVKIAEFTNLFTALPRVLDKYIAMADVVFDNITKSKSQIQMKHMLREKEEMNKAQAEKKVEQ